MESQRSPAPALARGIALLRQLSKDGQGSLEQLAARGGWPKSSTLRYLQSLQACGVVEQDRVSKVWHLRERLVSYAAQGTDVLAHWRGRLAALAASTGQCAELYRVSGLEVELMDRADPQLGDVYLAARIGFRRDVTECDATALLACAFADPPAKGRILQWRWQAGQRYTLPAAARRDLLRSARAEGIARDGDFNENGIRRFAIALLDATGTMPGILAFAQRLTPHSAAQTAAIEQQLSALRTEIATAAAIPS